MSSALPSANRWRSNLEVLVFLLGLGVLIHKSQLPDALTTPWPFLTTAFAVAALWRPGSRFVAYGLVAAVITEILWFWPYVVNHQAYLLFAGLIMLLSMVRISGSSGTSEDHIELESHLFPALRTGVYALFTFAVLHKLNHGSLNPDVSCAVSHYETFADRLAMFPTPNSTSSRRALIYGTLIGEAAIPVLLYFRRSRTLGLGVAFVFHFLMGINGHQAFSGFSPALYVPFLPPRFHELLAAHVRAFRQQRVTSWLCVLVPIIGSALGVLILIGGLTERYFRVRQFGLATFVLVIPALFFLFSFLTARAGTREAAPHIPARPLAVRLTIEGEVLDYADACIVLWCECRAHLLNKVGRTTGLTFGTIIHGEAVIRLNYPQGMVVLENQVICTQRFRRSR